ncbi:MAG: molybdopterin-dependent oxidoreductase [Chloroflexi bacterium]|nr:molybdopterin-dependent oxidoreductase [Chloroflexota bacterium]
MLASVIGQSIQRIDALEKITGAAEYVGDLSLKGMLWGKVLRSPLAHARILTIDSARARRLAGVRTVTTFDDTPRVPWNSAGLPPSKGTTLTPDQYILADKARYVGDAVAAVAAVDEDTAREALELISVEYEPLPAVLDPLEAMANGAPILHSAERNIAAHLPVGIGSVEAGFEQADQVFEDTYRTQKVFQCTIEPCSVSLATFDKSGRLTVWSSTQMPHSARALIARAMDMPIGRVRVIKPYVGGAFGSRLGIVNEAICSLLAQKSGKPVMVQYSREESFIGSESRHPIILQLKTGVKRDGTFTARQLKTIIDAGAYTTHTTSFARPYVGFWLAMYKCPNIRIDAYSVHTNTPPSGAYRGYGNPQAVFAVESQVDDIAAALGIDALEMRIKNHPCRGEPWGKTSWAIESCGLEEAIERAAASIGWKEKRGRAAAGPKKRGVGMAYMMHGSGARPGLTELSSAIIKINEDGSANVVYSTTDSGQGSATALSQIAAEEMGLRFEDVLITLTTDTDVTPFDVGSHASRQIYSGGNAVRTAAADVKEKILAQAAKMLEVSPGDLQIKDSYVSVKGSPDRGLSVGVVAREAHFGKSGLAHQIIGVASKEPPGTPPAYAAQFAEVEVDTETGMVSVIKMAAAHDVGTAINPANVEGQIEGALQQGIGFALTEQFVVSRSSGEPLNANFTDYKLLTSVDMPVVDTIIVEAPALTGPFGAKSIGESGLVATAAAIGNAIADAVGIRLKELPFTSEAILKALREKQS